VNSSSPQDLRIRVEAATADIEDIEKLLSNQSGVSLYEEDPTSSLLRSSTLHTLIVAASSSAGLLSIRSICVELIRSKRVTLTVEVGGKRTKYEGPLNSSEQLKSLIDAIESSESSQGGSQHPVS
jgi:hypothetical protein